jgi:hypothetical protein
VEHLQIIYAKREAQSEVWIWLPRTQMSCACFRAWQMLSSLVHSDKDCAGWFFPDAPEISASRSRPLPTLSVERAEYAEPKQPEGVARLLPLVSATLM